MAELRAEQADSQRRGVGRWRAGTKLAAALLTVGVAAALPVRAWWAQGLLALLLLGAALGSGAPLPRLLRPWRLLAVGLVVSLPLALLPTPNPDSSVLVAGVEISRTTLTTLWAIYSKSALVVLAVGLFASLMTSREALQAAAALHVPRTVKVLVWLAAAWVRNLNHMARERQLAVRSRGVGRGVMRLRVAALSSRALMGEALRVTDTLACALVARGFRGDLPALPGDPEAGALPLSFALYLAALGGIVSSALL